VYSAQDVPDQSGRTFFVTGANTGIGFEAARVLAQRGARVLLGCRSEEKAQAAIDRISRENSSANLSYVTLDLASLTSVAAAADIVCAEDRLDVLINNAGVMMPPKTLTQDGFESQFGVNHLGHFALTGRLLDKLMAQDHARVVTVSSNAHKFGRIDFADPHAERGYGAGARYGMSKLANLLFTFELQRRLQEAGSSVSALACHPGGADTELGRHFPKAMSAFVQPLARLVINSAAEGALPTLRAATDPQARGGEYYGPAGLFEIARSAVKVVPSLQARSEPDASRLWDLSVELTGVDPFARVTDSADA